MKRKRKVSAKGPVHLVFSITLSTACGQQKKVAMTDLKKVTCKTCLRSLQ